MIALAPVTWVGRVVRHLPAPLRLALDAWSHRIARERAARRRQMAQARR